MAKSVKTLNRFDAGIVSGPNSRDISDEAATIIEGWDPSKIGALEPIGQYGDATAPSYGKIFANVTGYQEGSGANMKGYGYGLHQFRTSHGSLYKHIHNSLHDTTGVHTGVDTSAISSFGSSSSALSGRQGNYIYTLFCGHHGVPQASVIADEYVESTAEGPHIWFHQYNIDDPSEANNGWYQLLRYLSKGEGSWQPDGGFELVNAGQFESALTIFQDSDNVGAWGDNPGAFRSYKPKFIDINGGVYIYDSNKWHSTYFLKYLQHAVQTNTTMASDNPSYEDYSQHYHKADQWVYVRARFAKPDLHQLDSVTSGISDFTDVVNDTGLWYITSTYPGYTITNKMPDEASELGENATTWLSGGAIGFGWKNNEDGGWTHGGPIRMWLCYVYDNDQEGPMESVELKHYPGWHSTDEPAMTLRLIFLKAGISSHAGNNLGKGRYTEGSPRICGQKIYYQYPGGGLNTEGTAQDNGIFLLLHVDYERGYRISGSDGWSPFENTFHENGSGLSLDISYIDPPTFEDFVTENGYFPGEEIYAHYGTAIWHKSRLFAGDIVQKGAAFPDRILKSVVGKPDVLPESNYIDLTGVDSERVIHLEAEGNTLYAFKLTNLYSIDISNMDEESLKTEHTGLGISTYNHCVKTPHGIAFVNASGIFNIKDDKLENLMIEEGVEKVNINVFRERTGWGSSPIDEPRGHLLYEQSNDKLIFVVNSKVGGNHPGDVFIYHFGTKSWTYGKNSFPQSVDSNKYSCSNAILDWQNRILIAGNDASSVQAGETAPAASIGDWDNNISWDAGGIGTAHNGSADLKFFHWQEFDGESLDEFNIEQNGLNWKSKDFDLGTLGAKKTLRKLYVTYKAKGSGDLHLHIKYSVDGDATLHTFKDNATYKDKIDNAVGYTTAAGLKKTDNKFRTIELRPNDRTAAKKFNTISVTLTNSTGVTPKAQLNVDDISIIYRTHSVK